jgi:hypothetical protein
MTCPLLVFLVKQQCAGFPGIGRAAPSDREVGEYPAAGHDSNVLRDAPQPRFRQRPTAKAAAVVNSSHVRGTARRVQLVLLQ